MVNSSSPQVAVKQEEKPKIKRKDSKMRTEQTSVPIGQVIVGTMSGTESKSGLPPKNSSHDPFKLKRPEPLQLKKQSSISSKDGSRKNSAERAS